ncbi:MAG: S8 family serine peptidase, partial [Lachnospiraceae bacterium]|nr:S8 family serine peptidase [Lachnospiraceae bacterium]
MKITAITPFPPSHVAGIIAGDGTLSGGHIQGIAPQAFIVSVRVLDAHGKGRLSAMLEGIRWLKENGKRLGIQIVNISVGSVKKQKENSQLVQAVESLWDSGLVICSAAGNEGMQQHNITSPGISRKIITVGSYDDKEMIDEGGRFYHNYSGRGPTIACICKPEIVAPGTNIVATNAMKGEDDRPYTVKSGTSMSTPMVSGAAALLLERYPKMTNTNVKLKLWKSAKNLGLPRSHQG